MPKIIELTVEVEVQKVSCPGVWLCQDGKVSLTIYTLGTTYQTCSLPPVFPLMFKDVFYFKKRFQESCAANNICCLLRNETIYCELVQWSDDCFMDKCIILAQYLGNLNDVLFPPNTCSNDGVDLLMRRAKDFPGILSPKIEIATKVRIDEVWHSKGAPMNNIQLIKCSCSHPDDSSRQKQVCHSSQYHRNRCMKKSSAGRRRTHSATRSCEHLDNKCSGHLKDAYHCGPRDPSLLQSINRPMGGDREGCTGSMGCTKTLLDSRYIDANRDEIQCSRVNNTPFKILPCVCEICRKYHELFHVN